MPSSAGRILTSHAGGLPRPKGLIEANRQRAAGGFDDEEGYQAELGAVADVVARQRETGIDLVNDGPSSPPSPRAPSSRPGGSGRASGGPGNRLAGARV